MTVFEKIATGELPSHKVYDDDQVMVIMSIEPVRPGHCLVIPKQVYENFYQMPDDLYTHLFNVVHRTAKKIAETYNPKRVAMIAHGFDVPHTHIHLFPSNESKDVQAKPLAGPDAEPDHEALAAEAEKLQLG